APRDRGALPGDPRAGGRGLRAGPRLRPAARRAGRGPAWNGARPRRPPGKPLRRLPAELLAGSAPDARLLDPARVASGRGARRARAPRPARGRARARRGLRRGQHGGRPAREGVRPAAPRGPAMRRAGARAALAGVTTLVLLALGGAVAPWLAPAGPYAADLTGRLGPPSDAHLF